MTPNLQLQATRRERVVSSVGLFNKKETEQKLLKRLSRHAGNVIELLKAQLRGPQGTDMTFVLLYAAGLAGIACHEAVKAEGGTFAVATTTSGKNYYLGDDVNRHLLESRTSVLSFVNAVCEGVADDVPALVSSIVLTMGTDKLNVWGMTPESVYERVKQCWDGIFHTMTSLYCKQPSDWPVFYGIVLQNVILQSISVGAPRDEVGKMAMECAAVLSRMDVDSL